MTQEHNMQRYEEDGMDDFGQLLVAIAAGVVALGLMALGVIFWWMGS
jgi:hypothetical protein